jgi:hypothetical protein
MKTLTTQITILIFLFLFPSVSFSQTFKCEFIQEKYKGGKSNAGSCSGDPELIFSTQNNLFPRHKHCKIEKVFGYDDYIDFIVDTSNKTVIYNVKSGMTSHGINSMVLFHKRKGDESEEEVRESYGKIRIRKEEGVEMTVQTSTEMVDRNKGNNYKGDKTTSYLITYKIVLPKHISENENLFTLYIPQNGKSIISQYNTWEDDSNSSWVDHKFGKCVNTSN